MVEVEIKHKKTNNRRTNTKTAKLMDKQKRKMWYHLRNVWTAIDCQQT